MALCVAACALLAGGSSARASTALVGDVHAAELRIAYSSAAWTTVWTSFRIDGPGPFAVIVPLPDGAHVDQSTDAFFESLEIATAPRVFPPDGLNPYCPGQSGPPDPFEIAASTAHVDSLSPESLSLAGDAPSVAAWAASQGLTLAAPVETALSAVGAARFLCVRFTSPGGAVTTPTLRVSAPAGLPALPFSITRAGATRLRVTSWFLGEGRAALDGTAPVPVPPAAVAWNAKTSTTDYALVRDDLLTSQPDGATLESASHDSLLTSVSIASDTATIDPVALTYYQRASAYGAAPSDVTACIASAKTALAADKPVGPTCPRGDIAAPPATCVATPPGPGEIDAAALTCGPAADDLALALSGSVGQHAVLTRRTFVIAQNVFGKDRVVSFGPAPALQPLFEADNIDVADCFGSGGSGGSGGSTGTTTSTITTTSTSHGGSGHGGSGSGATGFGALGGGGSYGYGGETAPNDTYVYIDPGCACNGTVDTADTAPPSDDCSSDSTGTASGDDCSSDTGTTSADACSGDSAGTASDCAVTHLPPPGNISRIGPKRRLAPRLSVLTLSALAALLPLRRRGTRNKRSA